MRAVGMRPSPSIKRFSCRNGGGFIFVSADFEVDRRVDTMLQEIEHDLLPAIAADLFPEK